ncbi:MAG: hypothetical protein VW455_13935 [Nitrospinota bacterium]
MFYEVKVLDANNHIKKIIPTKELSKRHWLNFEKDQAKNVLPKAKNKKNQTNVNFN